MSPKRFSIILLASLALTIAFMAFLPSQPADSSTLHLTAFPSPTHTTIPTRIPSATFTPSPTPFNPPSLTFTPSPSLSPTITPTRLPAQPEIAWLGDTLRQLESTYPLTNVRFITDESTFTLAFERTTNHFNTITITRYPDSTAAQTAFAELQSAYRPYNGDLDLYSLPIVAWNEYGDGPDSGGQIRHILFAFNDWMVAIQADDYWFATDTDFSVEAIAPEEIALLMVNNPAIEGFLPPDVATLMPTLPSPPALMQLVPNTLTLKVGETLILEGNTNVGIPLFYLRMNTTQSANVVEGQFGYQMNPTARAEAEAAFNQASTLFELTESASQGGYFRVELTALEVGTATFSVYASGEVNTGQGYSWSGATSPTYVITITE